MTAPDGPRQVIQLDLDRMSPDELEEHAYTLRRLAASRRKALTIEEARETVATVVLSPEGEASRYRGVLAVRAATKRLVRTGWAPAQIVSAMVDVALESCPDIGVARTAVAFGIADAREGGWSCPLTTSTPYSTRPSRPRGSWLSSSTTPPGAARLDRSSPLPSTAWLARW